MEAKEEVELIINDFISKLLDGKPELSPAELAEKVTGITYKAGMQKVVNFIREKYDTKIGFDSIIYIPEFEGGWRDFLKKYGLK